MSKFKNGDRVAAYGPGLSRGQHYGSAASRIVGIVVQEPEFGEDYGDREFLGVQDPVTGESLVFSVKACRKLVKRDSGQ